MNTLLLSATQLAVLEGPPIMVKIIFWILIILWSLGSFGWHDNPNWVRGSNVLLIILFAILGFYTLGF